MVLNLKNTLPKRQADFIEEKLNRIKTEFEDYVLDIPNLSKSSTAYLFSTIPLFPDGIKRIKELRENNTVE